MPRQICSLIGCKNPKIFVCMRFWIPTQIPAAEADVSMIGAAMISANLGFANSSLAVSDLFH